MIQLIPAFHIFLLAPSDAAHSGPAWPLRRAQGAACLASRSAPTGVRCLSQYLGPAGGSPHPWSVSDFPSPDPAGSSLSCWGVHSISSSASTLIENFAIYRARHTHHSHSLQIVLLVSPFVCLFILPK